MNEAVTGLRVFRCRVVRRLPDERRGREVVALVAAPSVRTAARLMGVSPYTLIHAGTPLGPGHQAERALLQPGVVLYCCPTLAHERDALWHVDLKKEPNLWAR